MSSLLLLLACLTLLVPYSQEAERVSARSILKEALHRRQQSTDPVEAYRFKRDGLTMPMTDLGDVMALDDDADLEVVQKSITAQGTQVVKMQERYQGRLIPDAMVTLEMDPGGNNVIDASGSVYRNIELNIEESSQLSAEEALAVCKSYNHDSGTSQESISHEKVQEEVLFDDDGNAYPAYLTQYLVSPQRVVERRPTCLIDARNSQVIVSWNDIDTCIDCSAKGIGGNLKIGKIQYGQLQRCLNVRRENGVCYLENKYVRVLNNNYTMNESDDQGNSNAEVGQYNCNEIDDYVNGAYSPLLDALFYGTVVARMFEDWYKMSPLGERITVRVHYGKDYSNAFWNGIECSFGDGDGYYMHPLVILDIMGHEIGHGVTEKNSNLYYYQQWGALNEAFSDMTGETSQAYLGEADWMMGFGIAVGDAEPIRYFDDPEKSHGSISHASDYTEFMDPHQGSGVYNRAFYLLVHEYGLPIKEVYGVFLHANKMYWHHMSNYEQAACDVMKSAYDLGQDGSRFREAFEAVGINVCDVEDHVMGLKNKKAYSNITVSKAISPAFVFSVPGQFSEAVTVTATSPSGEVYIILSDKRWGAGKGGVTVYAEGLNSVTHELPEGSNSTYVSIALTTDSVTPLTDVTLVARYVCIANYTPEEQSYRAYVLYMFWKENCLEQEGEDEGEPDSEDNSEEEEGEGGEGEEGEEEGGEEEGEEEGGEGEGGEGEGGEGEGGEGEEEEGEGGEGEGKESEEGEGGGEVEFPGKSLNASGHVFNFFKSFVIIVFPPKK